MRVIKVQGKGRVAVQPDTVVITFDVDEKAKEYKDCLNNLNQKTNMLRSDIEAIGRAGSELKTSNFSLRVHTKYTGGRHVFDGYGGSHTLRIEFPADKDILNKVLRQIAQGHSGAEIRLTFTVRDKEAVKKAALVEAVKTAQKNAQILAEAAGLRLGQIQQVDYGWAEIRIYDWGIDMVCQSEPAPMQYEPDIKPEDIAAEDNVTLVYEITE
jgi:uncharacterized protein